jgi:cytochrome P450
LYEEVASRCGQEPPSPEVLSQLPVLDAVTKEAMRLMPPVPCMVRRVRREGELAGLPIRPKNYVVINAFMTHRDPEVFPEPKQFRPERWLAGGAAIDSFAYVPFSGGPRTCIGKAMGTFNINLLVAMIVQRYRLSMATGSCVNRTFHVTLAPKQGMPMTVESPNTKFQCVPVTGNIHEIIDLNRGDASTCRSVIPISTANQSAVRTRRAA